MTGLITCTRRGHIANGGKVCSLFGVSRELLRISDKYDGTISGAARPTRAWAQWTKPADWEARARAIASVNHGGSKLKDPQLTLGSGRFQEAESGIDRKRAGELWC